MAKYLVQAAYTPEGLQGLAKDKASGRQAAVKKLCESAGGKLESIHYCFGEYDVVLIADFPDNTTAAAISLAAGASGLVRLKTTPLLTVQETDQALQKSVTYRAPGR